MATLLDKLWDKHIVVSEENRDLLYIDRHYIHEVTSPQAFSGLKLQNRKLRRPDKTFATMDHNVPTTINERLAFADDKAKLQVDTLEANCGIYGIDLAKMNDKRNGIVHIIGPEQGFSFPSQTIVCGDSHTATHGAFANLAFGIGTSEVEHVFATQTLWQTRPKTLGIKLSGKLQQGVTSKDIILALIAKYGVDMGGGYAIEFYGESVSNMSMDERMTMTNMSIEAGAKYGLIGYDETTLKYLQNTDMPKDKIDDVAWQELKTDKESDFNKIIEFNVSNLAPYITWGTSPEQGVNVAENLPLPKNKDEELAYTYTKLEPQSKACDIPVDFVFIGSCTNGRFSDLLDGVKYIKGRKVAKNVRAIIVPGSEHTRAMAEEKGIAKIYIDAGFEWRLPGCSACLGMNTDQIPEGKHCISTSNRNFVGRQGYKSITHLTSVPTAILAAIYGRIVDAREESTKEVK